MTYANEYRVDNRTGDKSLCLKVDIAIPQNNSNCVVRSTGNLEARASMGLFILSSKNCCDSACAA